MTKANFAKDQLKQYVQKVLSLEEEKAAISADISEVYKEAKGNGFDTKIMKTIIKKRKLDPDDLDEQECLEDTYRSAIGMKALLRVMEEAEEDEASAPPPPLQAAAE